MFAEIGKPVTKRAAMKQEEFAGIIRAVGNCSFKDENIQLCFTVKDIFKDLQDVITLFPA